MLLNQGMWALSLQIRGGLGTGKRRECLTGRAGRASRSGGVRGTRGWPREGPGLQKKPWSGARDAQGSKSAAWEAASGAQKGDPDGARAGCVAETGHCIGWLFLSVTREHE